MLIVPWTNNRGLWQFLRCWLTNFIDLSLRTLKASFFNVFFRLSLLFYIFPISNSELKYGHMIPYLQKDLVLFSVLFVWMHPDLFCSAHFDFAQHFPFLKIQSELALTTWKANHNLAPGRWQSGALAQKVFTAHTSVVQCKLCIWRNNQQCNQASGPRTLGDNITI